MSDRLKLKPGKSDALRIFVEPLEKEQAFLIFVSDNDEKYFEVLEVRVFVSEAEEKKKK